MRPWRKYSLDSALRGTSIRPADAGYREHARAMGGYRADPSYRSREAFFAAHFRGAAWGRFECYDDVLKEALSPGQKVLSLASGRCINELVLLDRGFDVTCSDLEAPESLPETRALFPSFRHIALDILKGPAPERFDAVVCLSLIYLFDAAALDLFFRNVAESLKDGGTFVLDSAGAPDNLFALSIREGLLKGETWLKRWVRLFMSGRWEGWVTQEFGWVRTDEEIIAAAARRGLRWIRTARGCRTVEFRRSAVLGRCIALHPLFEKFFVRLGDSIPYVRMFQFRRES